VHGVGERERAREDAQRRRSAASEPAGESGFLIDLSNGDNELHRTSREAGDQG
jgi:hypothetical protein